MQLNISVSLGKYNDISMRLFIQRDTDSWFKKFIM